MCPQVQDSASILQWLRVLCARVVKACVFLGLRTVDRVQRACELGHGTAGRELQATLLHNDAVKKLFAADFVLRGASCFFSNFSRSSIGIQQYSVQLSPLSAGQFFWSVVWFDSALIFGCVVRFYRIIFEKFLFH